eukprot:m.96192 g.96192  ORF g.96192 m.96192 type:complete len:609 (+) comp26874_c0_seq1:62-1888(+)
MRVRKTPWLLASMFLQLQWGAAMSTIPNVVPLPLTYTVSIGDSPRLLPSSAVGFTFTAVQNQSPTLTAAFKRFGNLLYPTEATSTNSRTSVLTNILSGCDVNVSNPSLELSLQTDESYVLTIPASGLCAINAPTVYGAMHGMETLVQLVNQTDRTIQPAHVADEPRFPFRATMIDTARHWLPVQSILNHIDAMAVVKMNVMHWHLVDSQSFPFVSTSYPQLSAQGAFHPTEVYTHQDITTIVQAAKQRGIRIIPEIDTPGHVWAGFAAIDGLLTTCYNSKTGAVTGTGPLDPTKDSTYTFLETLFGEITTLFDEKMFMVGGDEVDYSCWLSNPSVVAFVHAKGWSNSSTQGMAELESMYFQRLLAILAGQQRSVMCWEELFDNGLTLAKDTVINVWRGGWQYCHKTTSGSSAAQTNLTCSHDPDKIPSSWFGNMRVRDNSWTDTMAKAAAAGHHTVLSSPYYLNAVNSGSNFDEDWPFYYTVEPTAFDSTLGDVEKEQSVSGVEACLWTCWVNAANFGPRFWPRAAAVAERGWSAKETTSIDDFRRRLHKLTCEFTSRGLPAEPLIFGGGQFYVNGTVCVPPPGSEGVLGPWAPGCEFRFSSCRAHAL